MTIDNILLKSKVPAIIFLWIIHLSGCIGIALGHFDWFVTKTPLNLLYVFLLCFIYIPLHKSKNLQIFLLSFFTGIAVEWIGVHTGWLFGDYYYGDNLGIKLDGIPLLIGVNWGILVLCSVQLTRKVGSPLLSAALGALIMVVLDMAIEPLAPTLGFWYWATPTAPLYNYICWFIIGFILNFAGRKFTQQGDSQLSLHIILAQFLFFVSLNVIL